MNRSRTCFECPYSYSYSDTDSYGCVFFGEECAGNKKFDDDVCYVHPKRLQFLAQRMNKHDRALEKECCKYRSAYRKPVTSKKFIQGRFDSGYEVIANPDFLNSFSKFYRPNLKGGHSHRRNYCICSVCGHWFRRNKGTHSKCGEETFHFCSGSCSCQAEAEAVLEADMGGGFEAHYWSDGEA